MVRLCLTLIKESVGSPPNNQVRRGEVLTIRLNKWQDIYVEVTVWLHLVVDDGARGSIVLGNQSWKNMMTFGKRGHVKRDWSSLRSTLWYYRWDHSNAWLTMMALKESNSSKSIIQSKNPIKRQQCSSIEKDNPTSMNDIRYLPAKKKLKYY